MLSSSFKAKEWPVVRQLVWSGCGLGRFGKSSVFSLQGFNTNTSRPYFHSKFLKHKSSVFSSQAQFTTSTRWRARFRSWRRSGRRSSALKIKCDISERGWLHQQTWTVQNLQLFLTSRTHWPGKSSYEGSLWGTILMSYPFERASSGFGRSLSSQL